LLVYRVSFFPVGMDLCTSLLMWRDDSARAETAQKDIVHVHAAHNAEFPSSGAWRDISGGGSILDRVPSCSRTTTGHTTTLCEKDTEKRELC
jgi:hypothetical protein